MVNAEFLKNVPTHQGLPLPKRLHPDPRCGVLSGGFPTLVLRWRGGLFQSPACRRPLELGRQLTLQNSHLLDRPREVGDRLFVDGRRLGL